MDAVAFGGGVPDAVAPPPRHPRFPLVDGMRALAVLAVVGVHAALPGHAVSSSFSGRLLAHLNVGVTIFFVISGFLLYRPYIAHRTGGAPVPETAQYAKRRFLRIYPAYWLILTVLVVVPGLTGVVDGNWWPMYGLVHALPLYGGTTCGEAFTECGLAHTWSLVVELTFYAVLPAYAFAAGRLSRRLSVRAWMATQLGLLLALAALSVALQFVVLNPVPGWLTGSVAGYVFWFALGMGTAVASVRFGGGERRPWLLRGLAARPEVAWLLAFAAYVALSLWLPANPFLFGRRDALVAHLGFGVVATLLLAPAVFGDRGGGLPRRLLANPVVAWVGLVSYGIFLWHYVITLELVRKGVDGFAVILLATLAISIPIAAASYYLVERPLLRLKYRRLRDVVGARRRT